MDFKRNALIAGLVIVSYLMLLAWNKDYPAVAPQAANSSNVETLVQANSDLPNTSLNEPNSNPDLPQITQVAETPITTPSPANQSRLITISTPVHEVTIDLTGGDIVELSLPKYPVSLESPDEPFKLLQNNNANIYTAQSGLIGRNGPDANSQGRPQYQAQQDSYTLTESESELQVDLRFTDSNNINITKRFTFSSTDYLINVQYIIDNQSQSSWGANLFGQIKRDNASEPSKTSKMGMKTYLGAVLTTPDDPYWRVDFDEMDDRNLNEKVSGGWIGFSQHYFLSSWIPNKDITHTYETRKNSNGEYIMGFQSPEKNVAPGSTEIIEANFWAGPKDQYRLEEISPDLGLTIDYGFLWFVARPIFWLLTQIHGIVGNFGLAIIGLTVVVKTLFSPLSAASYRSLANTKRLAPKIAQIKERHGGDKQKAMQEQMALYKKEKVNPLGGCLPMLVQMPVLLGMYWVLNESVELRQAPFFLWYNDLSVMDPYFILPLIMGATMFISALMSPQTMSDPIQAKVMKFMPVIFTVFFLFFPSGLVLYWLVGNVYNIIQQWYITQKVNAAHANKTA